ncbi:MAG: ABC transporter permease [Acidobacteria bacterium]|nr:ABC transporter permease [Acidobacteriota bacterium]
MRERLLNLLNLRWFALIRKEFNQIKRNRRLIIMLIVPPTINIVLFGYALNPTVTDLKLGVVDESRSAESRELISALTESRSFRIERYYLSQSELGDDLSAGDLDAGLVIPADFDRKRVSGETAEVQFLVDAVNSNTATIAGGYAGRIINALNQKILRENPPKTGATPIRQQITTADSAQTAAPTQNSPARPVQPNVTPRIALLYNPGLKNAWFIVTGLIGALLVLQGSIVAAASMVREKEVGTIEQLLMTPAEAIEIITAKIAPIFLLLSGDIFLALTVARLVFDVPVRGSFLLFFISGSLCVLSGIGIGTLIATFVKSQQQAQLMSFFVNPPMVLLSGATTPVEAMPHWLQPWTLLNPVRHFGLISRGILLKGSTLDVLYPNLLALAAFCVIVVSISMWRFRKQLQ